MLYQTFTIATFKHLLQIYIDDRHFYFDLGKSRGKDEAQKDRDAFRNKYLDYVKKFNLVTVEHNTIKHDYVTIQRVNEVIQQENNAFKQEINKVKRENDDLKQENEELKYLVDPIMNRLNRQAEELMRLTEENERLALKSEKPPGNSDYLYQVIDNSSKSIAIKTISDIDTYPSPTNKEIQNLTALKTETPYLASSHKRKKRIKDSIKTKKKKL